MPASSAIGQYPAGVWSNDLNAASRTVFAAGLRRRIAGIFINSSDAAVTFTVTIQTASGVIIGKALVSVANQAHAFFPGFLTTDGLVLVPSAADVDLWATVFYETVTPTIGTTAV